MVTYTMQASHKKLTATRCPVQHVRLTKAAIAKSLATCDAGLAAAAVAPTNADRYIYAHLAAVRSATAYLKLIGATPPRGGARSVWDRLCAAAPEMSLWAAYFSAGTKVRRAVEAGESVSEQDCDELLAFAEDFRDEVVRALTPQTSRDD